MVEMTSIAILFHFASHTILMDINFRVSILSNYWLSVHPFPVKVNFISKFPPLCKTNQHRDVHE